MAKKKTKPDESESTRNELMKELQLLLILKDNEIIYDQIYLFEDIIQKEIRKMEIGTIKGDGPELGFFTFYDDGTVYYRGSITLPNWRGREIYIDETEEYRVPNATLRKIIKILEEHEANVCRPRK